MLISAMLSVLLHGFADVPPADIKSELPFYFGFGPMQIYKIKPGISQLKLADLNGDGRTDIALWNAYQNRVETFYQDNPDKPSAAPPRKLERNEVPDRGTMRRETVPVAARVASMEIADVTGDKRADLILFGEPRELLILPGKPTGGFAEAVRHRAPEGNPRGGGLACGDFNHDGRTDAALLGDEALLLFLQKPDGGLARPERLAHGIKQPLILLTSDLNGDGRDDLILSADEDDYGAYVFIQEASGGLGALRRLRVPKTRSLTVVRRPDGDDIFSVQYVTNRLMLYRWEPPTAESRAANDWPYRLYSYPVAGSTKRRPLAIGDVTGDGKPDLVAADPDGAQLILLEQGPSGLLPPRLFPGLVKATDVCVADVDGDGKNEVLSASAEEKMIGASKFADGRLSFPTPIPIRGEPQVVAAGTLGGEGAATHMAYLTQVDGESLLYVAPLKGGEGAEVQLGELEDDPAGLRFFDVDQDGRSDLLLFMRGAELRPFLQKSDGSFAALDGPDARSGLVKEASLEGSATVDVTGDGKPELILAQKSLARALVVRDGHWTVVDQFNAEASDAQISGLASLPGAAAGSPTLVMYDRKSRDLLVLDRRDDKTYGVTRTTPVGNFELSAMQSLSVGASQQLLLADARTVALVTPGEATATLVEKHAYESDQKQAFLLDAVVGDLNHDGARDVVVVDGDKANLEILTTQPDGGLIKATRFQVFQGKRFADDPDSRGEPREVLAGDVTGDQIDDIVLLTHDRLIIYPGQ
ncbi:FG-GAP repeat protein [Phycisphaerae bacterium RAS1]|nr:FG-GAP repeat protein [Phycisphaerae bacterium RAS1]